MEAISIPAAGDAVAAGGVSTESLRLLARRRSVAASQLGVPAPDAAALDRILRLAVRVPDHGALTPWRFIVLEHEAKQRFAGAVEAFAREQENPQKAMSALEKLCRPPLTVTVVSRAQEGRIPFWEQQLSAGAVCMNLLIAAQASGFGANWITGWLAYEPRVLRLLGLEADERIAGFVHLGTPCEASRERVRPELDGLVSRWG